MKKGLKRKLVHNKNGGIWTNLIMLIAIGLIIYQFIAPYVGLMSFTEFYSDYKYQQSENIQYEFKMIDSLTQNTILPTKTKFYNSTDSDNDYYMKSFQYYVLDKSDSHSLKLTTNVPYSLTAPYRVRFITKEIKQTEDVIIGPNTWIMEDISADNLIYESTGKLSSDEYIYNMGSEIRYNDGIISIYGNIYTIIVLSPNNEILYEHQFVTRIDD